MNSSKVENSAPNKANLKSLSGRFPKISEEDQNESSVLDQMIGKVIDVDLEIFCEDNSKNDEMLN